jgi:hypothetical protein
MVLGWEGGLFETFPSVAAQIRKAGQYDPSLDRIRMIGFGSPMFNLPIFLVFFAAQCGSWRVQIDSHHLLFPLSTFCQHGSVALVVAGRILRRLYQSGMQFMV